MSQSSIHPHVPSERLTPAPATPKGGGEKEVVPNLIKHIRENKNITASLSRFSSRIKSMRENPTRVTHAQRLENELIDKLIKLENVKDENGVAVITLKEGNDKFEKISAMMDKLSLGTAQYGHKAEIQYNGLKKNFKARIASRKARHAWKKDLTKEKAKTTPQYVARKQWEKRQAEHKINGGQKAQLLIEDKKVLQPEKRKLSLLKRTKLAILKGISRKAKKGSLAKAASPESKLEVTQKVKQALIAKTSDKLLKLSKSSVDNLLNELKKPINERKDMESHLHELNYELKNLSDKDFKKLLGGRKMKRLLVILRSVENAKNMETLKDGLPRGGIRRTKVSLHG